MIKNNWFNRTFRSKQVAANQREATRLTALYARRNEILEEIGNANNLEELLEIHKNAWNQGYRNANIGPCFYGMFRVNNIEIMKPEDVYLGNIYGLRTANIPFWEARKKDCYGANGYGVDPEIKLYDIIVDQYRHHLESNIKDIAFKAKQMIDEYDDNSYEIFYQKPC